MIFDQATESLYGADGTFIRKVHCPLVLRPMDLEATATPDRTCSACSKTIRNINEMTEEQVRQAGDDDPDLCVFATAAAKNIIFLQPWGSMESNWNNLPEVQTLRSLEAMQAARIRGFRLVFQDVGEKHSFGESKFIVFQNSLTGLLWWAGDYRAPFPEGEGWTILRDWFFSRRDRPFPLAAYAIPSDLPNRVEVFIPDIIEEKPAELWNQGNAHRLFSGPAFWDGKRIEIREPMSATCVG